jgi:hypothetical protein
MAKKYVALCVSIIILLIVIAYFSANSANACLSISPGEDCVVDKTPCATFTVKITFNNTGTGSGSWSVNIDFEDDSWSWKGTAQTLTLAAGNTETLVWNGTVPGDAPANSMARLVVYYDGSFKPLNWWIHVVSCAELTITSSTVE